MIFGGEPKMFMECKNMDRQEKYQYDGNGTVEDQNDRNVIQNHAEQAGDKGNQNSGQQKPSLGAQFFSVNNSMDDIQQ